MDTSSRNILADFLAATAPDRTARCRERDAAIVEELLRYLDQTDVAPHIGTDPAALISLEREFGGVDGSFFRVFGVDELVCCLPGFLDSPPVPPVPNSARVALVGRLLRWIWQGRMLGWNAACAFHDAEHAVARARRAAGARREARRTA